MLRDDFALVPSWVTQGLWTEAEAAISAKGESLGLDFTGPATSPVESIGEGLQQTFGSCTIYYSPSTGAHEVHGEILRKYVATNGPFNLGLPITDQQGTPDGSRYNDFALTASIYVNSNTGPMVVQGWVRDIWLQNAQSPPAEGYPVRDIFSPGPGEWACDFQNSVIWANMNGTKEAWVASLTPDKVLAVIWSYFDKVVHESPQNIGLHPERSLVRVSDTAYDFWQSRNRLITVELNGFHDNGLALPDANFTATLTLLFKATYRDAHLETGTQNRGEALLQPAGWYITVSLDSGSVHATGIGHGDLSSGVADAIGKAFSTPIALGIIPDNVPLLSFKVGQDGGIYAMISPTLAGGVAVVAIQHQMDSLS